MSQRISTRFGRSLSWAAAALPGLLLFAGPVQALTVTSLKDVPVAWAFGQYAPGGNCAREPRITVDQSGFTFTLNGKSVHPPRFEYAVSYAPDTDPAKMGYFFPFPNTGGDEMGAILLTLQRSPASILLDNNIGRPLPQPYGALAAASPYRKCAAAPKK